MTPPSRARSFILVPAAAEDFEALAALRERAMRESLERLGRFDPVRSRARLQASFVPADTRHIDSDGVRVGFVCVSPQAGAWQLKHLYIDPLHQGTGLGSIVLQALCREAEAQGAALHVTALRDSDANRFYLRHGFREVGQETWDIHYVRPVGTTPGMIGS